MAIIATDTDRFESVNAGQKDELMQLLDTSTYDYTQMIRIGQFIMWMETQDDYERTKQNLLVNQMGIDGAVNPGQREINKHVRKISKEPAA